MIRSLLLGKFSPPQPPRSPHVDTVGTWTNFLTAAEVENQFSSLELLAEPQQNSEMAEALPKQFKSLLSSRGSFTQGHLVVSLV